MLVAPLPPAEEIRYEVSELPKAKGESAEMREASRRAALHDLIVAYSQHTQGRKAPDLEPRHHPLVNSCTIHQHMYSLLSFVEKCQNCNPCLGIASM